MYELELFVVNEYLPTKKESISEIDDYSPGRQRNMSTLH